MPISKKSKAALAQNAAKARDTRVDKTSAIQSETAFDDLWTELQTAKSHITQLEISLDEQTSKNAFLVADLEEVNQKLNDAYSEAD